jgi:hypothetical protein
LPRALSCLRRHTSDGIFAGAEAMFGWRCYTRAMIYLTMWGMKNVYKRMEAN